MAKDEFGKRVLIVIILIIILGAIFYFSNYKTPTTKNENTNTVSSTEILDTPLVYQKRGEIWLADLRENTAKKIASGIKPLFSKDKKNIAYSLTSSSLDDSGNPFDQSQWGLHTYNIETKEDKLLFQSSVITPSALSWSTDGKYLAMNQGLSDYNSKKIVLNTEGGNEFMTFRTWSTGVDWISDTEIIYSEPQEVSPKRFYGETGEGEGLTIINIEGEKNRLFEATNIKSFRFLEKLDEDSYKIATPEVKNPKEWEEFEKVITKYWTYNFKSNELEEIIDYKPLNKQLREVLPAPYNDYSGVYSAKSLSRDRNWVAFILNETGQEDSEEIYIMNLNDSSTLRKIDKGSAPNW